MTRLRIVCTDSSRGGIAILAVIVVFAVSTALFGVWARAAIQSHRQLALLQKQSQAIRLAEAGLRRAIARRQADPRYDKEVWTVPASDLSSNDVGKVQIRVTTADDDTLLQVEATAEFPVGTLRRAKVTQRATIANTNEGTES